MDSFIKENHLQAELSVTICNEPRELAYKYEFFGPEITIERVLKRDSPSVFHFKSSKGEAIKFKRDDLNDLCSFFGIQVENPLVVLTQELSKRFLSTSNPENLYEVLL